MASPELETADGVAAIIDRHRDRPGALLPILHDIQSCWGHIPEAAVAALAHGLNLSRAEVHGVISFYHDFRYEPAPRVRVCMGEACQAMGSAALMSQAAELTQQGVEPVYCLGNCACAPNIQVGRRLHGRVDESALPALVGHAETTA